jgi:hypothetical protein
MSPNVKAKPRRGMLWRGVELVVAVACAALTAVVVHARLFSAPPGELVAASTSLDSRWDAIERPYSSWRTAFRARVTRGTSDRRAIVHAAP